MANQVCIAVIGCGRIAQNAHFPALAQIEGVRVKYACDIIIEKAESMKATYSSFVPTSFHKICSSSAISSLARGTLPLSFAITLLS